MYGLAVNVGPGVELLGVPAGGEGDPPERTTDLAASSPEKIAARWSPSGAVREREVRHTDGDLLLAIDRHDGAGYLVDAPHHGRFLVAPDGAEVLCAPREDNPGGAQAVLLGQVLTLAATLRGCEVLHAGAVAVGGRAALICAASGTGKSNLIARLVLAGASLVADDAVAVAATGGKPVAFPGPSFVHLFARDVELLPAGDRLVPIEGFRTGKVALGAVRAPEQTEIAAVYLLERGEGEDGLRIADQPEAAKSLLAATFVSVARTEERLQRHLETCAEIAEHVPMRRIELGGASREAVAEAVWRELTTR